MTKAMKPYLPKPIDTSNVIIPQELENLAEILAENVHENWAFERLKNGWTYGPARNDEKKLHPCLISYEDLPESEKIFDNNSAMETIKVILSMGYTISKK